MPESFTCQGRVVHSADIQWLQSWIVDHPSWSRYRLACELCKLWDWSTPTGKLKDFAAPSFLVKLMARGLIALPPVRTEKRKVPHLASHLLSLILKRISADWQHKYGHPLHLIETFVERDRFRGTCYRGANWQLVGQTTGRSRQDRHHQLCSIATNGDHFWCETRLLQICYKFFFEADWRFHVSDEHSDFLL